MTVGGAANRRIDVAPDDPDRNPHRIWPQRWCRIVRKNKRRPDGQVVKGSA
jgi:hypothetical protein